MSAILEKMKKGSTILFIVCIVIGVLFCIWPSASLMVLCMVIGAILIIIGIVLLAMALKRDSLNQILFLLPGVICLVLGLWIFFRPATFVVLIPVVIGIVMIYHGIRDISYMMQINRMTGRQNMGALALAVITLVIGLLLIVFTWQAIKVGMIFIGIALVYDGIAGLFLLGKATRNGGGTWSGRGKPPIDVDYKEE